MPSRLLHRQNPSHDPRTENDQIMQVARPPTDAIGDKPVWMLGQRDLTRLARDLLAAAKRLTYGLRSMPLWVSTRRRIRCESSISIVIL